MFFNDWLARWHIYTPDQIAIVDLVSSRRVTYQEMNRRACAARLLVTPRGRDFSGQSGRLSLNEPARVSRSLLRLRKNRRDPCAAELPSAGRGADCTDPGIAGRACAEYVVQIPGIDKPFIFMANHFSSKGSDPTGLKRRLPQATQVEKIVADRLDQGLTTL